MPMVMNFPHNVLDFWLGPKNAPDFGKRRSIWFESTEAEDLEICDKFLATYEKAAVGELDDHKETIDGCLGLIITLDQLPRNMFRATPRSFATDEKALNYARIAIECGYDRDFPPLVRMFFYLPFEHSECLEDQRQCVELVQALPDYQDKPRNLKFARRHLEIIERFGRFAHRNDILGRSSTMEEIEFLKEPDSSFIWPKNRQK